MKYYLLAACMCFMGAAAVMVSSQKSGEEVASVDREWKYNAVEAETSVRPPHFAEMRYDLDQAPQVRGPASKKKN